MDTPISPVTIQFDRFRRLRGGGGLLRQDTAEAWIPVSIGSRALAVLGVLIEQRGALVSKDAIMRAVWPDTAVEEHNLAVQISVLRRLLDDNHPSESCIQTVTGRGYRFRRPAMALCPDGDPFLESSMHRFSGPRLSLRPVEACVLQFGPEIVEHALPGTTTLSPPSAPRLSIVVLPFANIGGDPEQDYFVDGVTESLTTDLSRISGSFVIARNTAFTFKGRAVDVKRVGRELNVRYVLDGSVRRGGNRLRVNVQLVDAETGNHLWAERFEKPIADLFDMQDEIVSRLANILNAQLIEAEARRAERSLHPDAVELYFQGMACFNKGRTAEYTTRARGFFERALALDPKNVEALVAMAEVDEATGTSFLANDRAARFAAAETALIKALSLTPQHAPSALMRIDPPMLNKTDPPTKSAMSDSHQTGSCGAIYA
jgi:TolB-like protein/DNA-binding winged helix-turn-helix (wHTH) protein